MITLESFKLLKKLSVKNIIVEAKKIKASYCVENLSGNTFSTELIYSYDKSYFNPKNAVDINLASIMLAQVALNYGLFFETIEFDGLYDKTDREFIESMMENTSREIITNKLLMRNEFLKAPYDNLYIEKRQKYTSANIIFTNNNFKNVKLFGERKESDHNKFAILSSGGKDSLLTYGIIKELGIPYPVFINESGRHWFTALNAYRHFKEAEPNTEKPWCNSDRVFNWMLKQLPFIRENYASIRSDIYPVRLWTVAVFIFGALPVALKNGIGNILVGNEYDTTITGIREGIKHYHGLYDQSRYFDNAMTRYYQKKGWQIKQYSILRSTSELLIMKMLVKRYPELQKQQVSCHAAHEKGGRIYPCGKCEKCRRIVGMLMALDEKPQNCGYTEEQIRYCLKSLESSSIKQLGSDAAHLYHLLLKKNLIEENSYTSYFAKEHPEITKLRFDSQRSKIDEIPSHLQKPLTGLLLKYSDGAVKRANRKWEEIKPDNIFTNTLKYNN